MCLSSIFEFFIMRQFGARLYHSKNLNVDYRTYLVLICVVNFEIFIFLNVMYDQEIDIYIFWFWVFIFSYAKDKTRA
jgi:hypothetical protein